MFKVNKSNKMQYDKTPIHLRIDQKLSLEKIAQKEGVSKQELIRQMIDYGIENYKN